MKAQRRLVVAIDGPAGAGKTTVARQVAQRLGYLLVDTGALYRSVALAAQRAGVSWDDVPGIERVAQELVQDKGIELRSLEDGTQNVLLYGEDASLAIRAPEVGEGASKVSALAGVRQSLLDLQRSAGRAGGAVLEGRDIGTVVFPDADVKFYLTAGVEVRARRRCEELRLRGHAMEMEAVRREVEARDRRDTMRPVAPLRRSPDAFLVDSSALTIDQVVDRIVNRVEEIACGAESGG